MTSNNLPTPLTNLKPADLAAISFDLDDTLHAYRQAAKAGMAAVYAYIEDEFGITADAQAKAYQDILAKARAVHFVIDQPAREYRRGRFDALFEAFSIVGMGHTDICLNHYDDALTAALTPLDKALDTLIACKQAGLTVLVLTEGPTDAQQGVLDHLGFATHVDHLFTSASTGKAKDNGLYDLVAKRLRLKPDSILHIGDNPARDGAEARAAGWHSLVVRDDLSALDLPLTQAGLESLDRVIAWLATDD